VLFRSNAAKKAGQKAGQDLFIQLSEFEQFHYAKLTILEKSLGDKGEFVAYEGRKFPVPPKLGPKSVDEPNHQTVINIINQAMELEKLAERTYADLAAQISDEQGHDMFIRLSEEEHKHYRILNDAYWSLSNMKGWRWGQA
jgi:rubrerythrin